MTTPLTAAGLQTTKHPLKSVLTSTHSSRSMRSSSWQFYTKTIVIYL